jgi:HNH endonuclease
VRRKVEPTDVFLQIGIPEDGNHEACWPWTGKLGTDGRPYITIGGVKLLAYRVVYTLVYGPIAPGNVIRHKVCDNEACCNPWHLLEGTQSDNELDKYEHERWGFPHAVIDDIRRMHAKGLSQKVIATAVTYTHGVKVTQQRVSDIITGVRRSSHE